MEFLTAAAAITGLNKEAVTEATRRQESLVADGAAGLLEEISIQLAGITDK